ncbi:ABC transporter substrate-binding protein [Pectobacterium brasiliense]|uniref:ABC transporter substrate-binding protein n=1 Tax=Pectobacterium brasiliense TaxID=180957 RepID=A0AAW9HBV9_9GAMM|nr:MULTISPECIES: ABC transporter substrate-binding protein [Pectobacterium]APS31730.1 ABC transporter substrate-binding protein [Pectobacterium brasiliense]KFF64756.1 ABC transporter substrate-binding protein [Pectobacterium brasiliense]KHS64646.1 ABC transporter substrate-binding protein [Pectobacterium brasiliense]KHS70563.1 ABC transporter substrate-binding protein [Pectobacterium brasiliense]KHS77503.1 ABC transporter substrate-binding protein [Pectobacterium brasiliense]
MKARAILRTLLLGSLCMAATPAILSAKTPDDQLIVGMNMNNMLSLDPAAMTGNEVVGIIVNLYDSLVVLDPANLSNIQPSLAKSWSVSDDGKVITFNLVDNAKFHSGNPVTAQDFAWSMKRLLNLNMAQATTWKSYGFTAENVEKMIRAKDAHTVEIELPKPNDPKLVIYSLATLGSGSVLDSKTVMQHEKNGDWGNGWLTTNEAGSGPFKLDVWQAKDVLRISKVENNWQGDAKMRRVIFRHMTESQALRLMIEKGDIDVASGMSVPDINALKQDKDVVVDEVQKGTLYYVAMSLKNEYFAKPKVREAVRYLIDYDGVNKTVMPGYGFYHQRPIQKGMDATLPDPGYKLDVPRAKALLAEAGYPNGFETTLRVLSDQPFLNLATSVQSTLAQAGIKAKIISGTGNQVYGAMRDRNFDMLVGRGGGGVDPHPHSSLRSVVYNPDNSDEAKLTNFQGWRTSFYDKPLNDMIDQALLEKDPQKQKQMYINVQNRYEELFPAIIPVSQMIDSVVLRKDVKGYVPHPSSTTHLREVYKQR